MAGAAYARRHLGSSAPTVGDHATGSEPSRGTFVDLLAIQRLAGNAAAASLLNRVVQRGPPTTPAPPTTAGSFGNMFPEDVPGGRSPFVLKFDGRKWREVRPGSTRKYTATGTYNFVVQDGKIYAHKRLGHVDLAKGGRTTFAGSIEISGKGELKSWTQASGHYRPSKVFASQAGLDMGKFKPISFKGAVPGPQLPVLQPGSGSTGGVPHPAPHGPTGGVHSVPKTTGSGSAAAAHKPPTPHGAPHAPSLGRVARWGKVSPLDAAFFYLDMHAAHFAALEHVMQRVALANQLIDYIDELELGARELHRAVEEVRSAEAQLPTSPIASFDDSGQMMVTPDELRFVEQYYDASARIANDAMAANAKLSRAIRGWEDILESAQKNKDFTRGPIWVAIAQLDLKFQKDGSGFKAYMSDTRQTAANVQSWARQKQYMAADVLGKWTPEGYQPPATP